MAEGGKEQHHQHFVGCCRGFQSTAFTLYCLCFSLKCSDGERKYHPRCQIVIPRAAHTWQRRVYLMRSKTTAAINVQQQIYSRSSFAPHETDPLLPGICRFFKLSGRSMGVVMMRREPSFLSAGTCSCLYLQSILLACLLCKALSAAVQGTTSDHLRPWDDRKKISGEKQKHPRLLFHM